MIRYLETLAFVEASSRRLTGSVTVVSGLRLDANSPVGTVGCVANLHKVLFLTSLLVN